MNVFLDYGCLVSMNQPRLVQYFIAKFFITFRKNVHTDFYGYLDVNFAVSVFDPNNINNTSYNLFNKNYTKFTNREIFFG
ncbi:hypothetical protein YC2023_024126 [Brassica napus]